MRRSSSLPTSGVAVAARTPEVAGDEDVVVVVVALSGLCSRLTQTIRGEHTWASWLDVPPTGGLILH